MIRLPLQLALWSLLATTNLVAQKQPDLKKLDAYIADAVKRFDQPGMAVGIVQNGKLVWSKGYGKLDLAKPEPVTPNSIFFMTALDVWMGITSPFRLPDRP